MEAFLKSIKCQQCGIILESPVILPCSHSVCKKHEKENTTVVCTECEEIYDVPSEGYSENKALAEIIFSRISELELEPERKKTIKECNKLIEKIEEAKRLVDDPKDYIYDCILDLKLRIQLSREKFKLQIDQEAEMVMEFLEEYENECKKSSSSNEIESKVKEIKIGLEKTTIDLESWTKYLDNFKVSREEYENIQTKCEETILRIKNELALFQETLLTNTTNIHAIERFINGFEKIDIVFDYR
jgi:hypothetical protein